MKAIVADSSSLISLSMSCLFDIIPKLADIGLQIVLPKAVFEESIAEPMHIKRFELSAYRIGLNIKNSNIKVVEPNEEMLSYYRKIMQNANTCFKTKEGFLKILHYGEAQMLAVAKVLNASALLIDERTTRLLIENPIALRTLLEKRHSMHVSMDEPKAEWFRKQFKDIAIIRSSELVALAYEKKLLPILSSPKALEAALYAVKFAGCAINLEEIESYIKTIKGSKSLESL